MRYLSGGESHGPCLTGIIEGLPAGLEVTSRAINSHLARRQQGYGRGGRMSIERDRVELLSGLRFNRTLGSPLTMRIANRDWENWREIMAPEGERPRGVEPVTRPRPGHADLAGGLKYGHNDLRDVLERSSARETAIRVAVGSVARLLLERFGMNILSHVISIGRIKSAGEVDGKVEEVMAMGEAIESSPFRCADAAAGEAMAEEVDNARREGDTLGGIFEVLVTGAPPGLGSYVYWDRRLDGRLAGAMMSLQGIKGVELGDGFEAAVKPGSLVHDVIKGGGDKGFVRPTNRAGGLEGGMTNGEPIIIRAAMKPIPTMARPLESIDLATGEYSEAAVERSDVCAVPAAAVVAESLAAWELAVAFREKFAGDTIEEMQDSFNAYLKRVEKYLGKSRG